MLTVALLMAAGVPALGQSALAPVKFNDQAGPCADARVAARGRESLAIGWTVAAGEQRGVWLRWRVNFAIEPVARRIGGEMEGARDLAMTFDGAGRLHMVWTALADGERRLYHTRVDRSGEAPGEAQVLAGGGSDPATAASLDFASIAAGTDGSVLVAWQESRGVRFTMRALSIAEDGVATHLGVVSGASQSGINPQILSASPPRIVWEEITERASRLRVNEWDAAATRWRPSTMELEARRFESRGQVILRERGAGQGLIGCWQQTGADRRVSLIVGRPESATEIESPGTQVFDQPPGDHGAPSMAASRSGRPTVAWQVLMEGRQAICIAPASGAMPVQTISPPTQRFAAMPDHVTIDRWSAVAWIDNARDGGTGDVYFAEVSWPTE